MITAISPMESVSRGIRFEGRKSKENPEQPTANTSTLKAVPLAVLLAMSPLSSSYANTNTLELEPQGVECVESPKAHEPQRKEVMRLVYPNASEKYGDATIIFYDTDNNEEDAEETVLQFHVPRSRKYSQDRRYELTLKYLKVVEINDTTLRFFACGNGTKVSTHDDGKVFREHFEDIKITEKFADFLYNLDDELEVKRERLQVN